MIKWKGFFMIGILAVVLCVGCGTRDLGQMIEDHKAETMNEEGVWERRYERMKGHSDEDMIHILSVNVLKDMSEDDMREVLDYYELCLNSEMDETGAYVGKRDNSFICFAVFYRGDTDEELKRFKYVDGESVEITEEDKEWFAGPELRDVDDEMEELEE